MKAVTKMAKNMVTEFTLGLMALFSKVTFRTIKLMDPVLIIGETVELMKENGKTTICTDKVNINGLTKGNTRVNTLRIKRRVTESTSTLMEVSIRVCGRLANNMAKALLS